MGCGRGETLRRIAARWPVRAVGYDLDAEQIELGRGEARADVELIVAGEPPAGVNELVVCIASSHALGGFPEALGRLRDLAVSGGQVLLGEGYWRRPPSDAYLKALGDASEDELAGFGGLLDSAQAAGLVPLWSCVADDADWDRYEWTQVLNCERWSERHPDHPAAGQLSERAARTRTRLAMPAGRETLGFALVLLRRD